MFHPCRVAISLIACAATEEERPELQMMSSFMGLALYVGSGDAADILPVQGFEEGMDVVEKQDRIIAVKVGPESQSRDFHFHDVAFP